MRAPTLIAWLCALPLTGAVGQAVWTVDRAPTLDVPGIGADGKVTFGYAAGATRLANGSLLIADRAENGIRVIDAAGKLLRTIGRAGDGPGEFQTMIWAGGCGADSMLVWDLRRRQASMVGASGTVARQFAVPARDTAQLPFQFSCAHNRAMVYLSLPRPIRDATPPQDPNIRAVTAAVYRIAADGAVTQRLGDIPAGEVLATVSPTGGRGSAPRPLGRTASVAAVGNDVVIGSADSATATVVHDNGTRSQIRIPVTIRAPTRAEFDAAVQASASMIPAPIRQAMIAQLAAVPMPERLPAISALFGDPDGLLWVQSSPVGAKVIDFIVIQVDGRVVARAQIPLPLTIFEIGRDYILGSYSDAGDEMHVAVYRLRRQ